MIPLRGFLLSFHIYVVTLPHGGLGWETMMGFPRVTSPAENHYFEAVLKELFYQTLNYHKAKQTIVFISNDFIYHFHYHHTVCHELLNTENNV